MVTETVASWLNMRSAHYPRFSIRDLLLDTAPATDLPTSAPSP